jgi:hypothetical protein
MSAFFFTNGKTFNVIVPLDELEAAIALLAAPNAVFHQDHVRWRDYAANVARVFETRGRLIVLVDKDAGALPGWRGELATAPERCRDRVRDACARFVPKGRSFHDATVEIIA